MAKGKGGAKPATPAANRSGDSRPNGKAVKKSPLVFDAVKRRLVKKTS
jgi:hypothetical protein